MQERMIGMTEARHTLTSLVDELDTPVVILRNNKPVAILLKYEDYPILKAKEIKANGKTG